MAFLPDGKQLVSGAYDHLVSLWNVEDGKALCQFTGHKDRVNSVAVSFGRFQDSLYQPWIFNPLMEC